MDADQSGDHAAEDDPVAAEDQAASKDRAADPDLPRFSEADRHFMRRAVELARRGIGRVEPNPPVGCVLVTDGRVVGEGWHQRFGDPHAEVEALRSRNDTHANRETDCTAYVTLEPCCHHGKTPPCTGALLNAGIRRVVIGTPDPFPKVDGGGIVELRRAGVKVSVGCLRTTCEDLIAPFRKLVTTGMPWIIAKWAMTMDGAIATAAGESQWITGEIARAEVHRRRGLLDGILVGHGTLRADDPLLTARPTSTSESPPRVPTRMVMATQPIDFRRRLFQSPDDGPVCVFIDLAHAEDADRTKPDHVELVPIERLAAKSGLMSLLRHCGGRGHTRLLIEGGSRVLGAFFDAECVDQCEVYLGNVLFGGDAARRPVGGTGIRAIRDASRWRMFEQLSLGPDRLLVYRR